MQRIEMNGTLSIDIASVLMELSLVPKKGMIELTTEGEQEKWRLNRLNQALTACGSRVFYRLHPETLDFLECVWHAGINQQDEKYLNLHTWPHESTNLADLIVEREWKRAKGGSHPYFIHCFNNTNGWAIIGSAPPTSNLLSIILSRSFSGFDTNVMGRSSTEVRKITKAIADEHYIQFSMRDRKGGFNSLLALVPRIVETLKKPCFPTPEIQELCDGES